MAKELTSILTDDMTRCFLTGSKVWVERHHCFYGFTGNRPLAEEYGLIMPISHYLHEEKGLHVNDALDLQIKQYAQRQFEEQLGTREEFMRIFGKNYIMDDDVDGYEIDIRACGYNIPEECMWCDDAC